MDGEGDSLVQIKLNEQNLRRIFIAGLPVSPSARRRARNGTCRNIIISVYLCSGANIIIIITVNELWIQV